MTYDPLNRVITRNVNGAVTQNVWDGWNLIEEHRPDWSIQRCYLHGAKQNEMVVAFDGNVYSNHWFWQDGRGNTSHITGDNAFLLESYTYDLSGAPKFYDEWGGERWASAYDTRFLFAGSQYLPETGLYDMRNRFYHIALSRFVQIDPIGFQGDRLNLYRYCHNDPVDFSDPMGLYVYSLTSTGGGEWSGRADGITNYDVHLLNEARILDAIRGFEKIMNERPGDPNVKWSGRVNQVHEPDRKFADRVVATTDWEVPSKASSNGGKITGFSNQLNVNIYWNDSAPARYQLLARNMTSPRGEFAHARDAFWYGWHSGSRKDGSTFRSARDVASGVARSLVGTNTPTGIAGRQMEDALRPWVDDSMAASKMSHDPPYSDDHQY